MIYKPSPSYIRAIIPFGYKHINNLPLSSFFSKSPEPIQTTLEYTLSRITTQDHKSNLIQHPNSFTTDLSHVPSETHCNQNLFRKPTWLQKYHQTQSKNTKRPLTITYNHHKQSLNQIKRNKNLNQNVQNQFPKQHQPVFSLILYYYHHLFSFLSYSSPLLFFLFLSNLHQTLINFKPNSFALTDSSSPSLASRHIKTSSTNKHFLRSNIYTFKTLTRNSFHSTKPKFTNHNNDTKKNHCHPLNLWHTLSPEVEGTTTTGRGTTEL